MEDTVYKRCGDGVDITARYYQNDGCYSCRMSGIWTDSVGEEDRGHAPVVRFQQRRTRCELRLQGKGINRQTSLCTLVVLSARARTSRISIASALLGQISEDIVPTFTTDGTPGCRLRSGCSTLGGRGSYAVLMCHVDYVLTGL